LLAQLKEKKELQPLQKKPSSIYWVWYQLKQRGIDQKFIDENMPFIKDGATLTMSLRNSGGSKVLALGKLCEDEHLDYNSKL
jgi:hypothetical protein